MHAVMRMHAWMQFAMMHSLIDIIHAGITIPPRSVNESLNGVAEFNCTGTADAFTWPGI